MSLERISHYRVDRLIGVGGMGEVYLAEDTILHRNVALKFLPERFTQDPERVHRFQREARAASALNHPNIITIYEIGGEAQRHYIATEYIEGETLRKRIGSAPSMRLGEVLHVSIGVADALATAHEAGIIHRDIKPDNVMVRRDGYVKVLDFGLAKLTAGDLAGAHSATGAVLGTLLYIAPEQARGTPGDARSDIYSLGAVMYEMLTGQPPVVTDSFVELAIAIASRNPDPPSAIASGVPPELDRIVLKALEKKPEHRYTTSRELLEDLRTLRRELEFDDKLTSISGDTRLSPPLLATTAPLGRTRRKRGFIAHLNDRIAPAQLAGIVLILLCVSAFAYAFGRYNSPARKVNSIAVLPFVNASGDPNSEYLSDGIAQSIIDDLAQITALKVVARNTSFKFRGKNNDPVEIGNKLGVRGVVTGQVIHRGDTLIIRASLIDARDGSEMWGEQYNRRLSDVLAIQQDIASAISSELRTTVTGDQKKPVARRTTGANSEAYRAYLRGNYQLNKHTYESVRQAITYFNDAIGIDPTYALAHAGLAHGYYGLSNIHMAPREAMPRAREAAERAVQLDGSLGEAHSALALVRTWYDWDFAAGEREFRRAIELSPNNAEAHRLYGDLLLVRGLFDRAIQEKAKAVELDPLSVVATSDLGRSYFYAGRYDEADRQAMRAIDLDQNFPNAYLLRAQIATERGQLPQALVFARKAVEIGGHKPYYVSFWGYVSARSGDRDAALAAIRELESSPSYTLPLFLSRVNTALGNRDQALYWLGLLYNERSESVVWLKVDPTLRDLHGDPRFAALVKRIGI